MNGQDNTVLPARRLAWIDLSKGLAIFLVVFAHLMKYDSLPLPDWYALAKFKIYLFHMPFFMFLSGYVFFYAGYHKKALNNFPDYIAGRADRLLVPFFALGLAVVLAKVFLSRYFFIEEAPTTVYSGLASIFIHTENSPVLTIWYLVVLFAFATITPPLLRLLNNRLEVLFLVSIILYFLPTADFLYLNRVFQFYPFFLLSGFSSVHRAADHTLSKPLTGVLIALFIAALALPLERTFGLLICGTLSCFAIPQLIRLSGGRFDRALMFLGDHTMVIYLLNVPAIGLVKALYLKSFGYEAADFYTLASILLIAGIFIPVAVKSLLCKVLRIRPLCRYMA